MKKTYKFENDNGIFISFLDYESEDDFSSFLAFLSAKMSIPRPLITVSPYSLIAEFEFRGAILDASYDTDAGCSLRIPPDSELSAEAVIGLCYGEGNLRPPQGVW